MAQGLWVKFVLLSLTEFLLCEAKLHVGKHDVIETLHERKSQDEKIYGGRDAGDVPFLVSIQRSDRHFCGGTILTIDVIYTACHCVAKVASLENTKKLSKPKLHDPEDFTIVAGEKDLRYESWRSQKRNVKDFLAHPKCHVKNDMLSYDYALITLTEPLEKTPHVAEAKLRRGGKEEYDARWAIYRRTNKRCSVFGWGKTESGDLADTLRVTAMRIIPDRVCAFYLSKKQRAYANYNFHKYGKACATGMMKNNSDCEGDSGGPVYCEGYVMGAVSYGFDCGEGEQPAVYATMGELIVWYNSLLKKSPHRLRSGETVTPKTSWFLCILSWVLIVMDHLPNSIL